MSENQPETVDLKGEYIEHIHLLSGDRAGWNNLNLIYELEPAGEMPAAILEQHAIMICLGDFRASFEIKGNCWQHEHYTTGDIVIFPAGEVFPKVQIDRVVPLIELFLAPETLNNSCYEAVKSQKVELSPQFKLRDPLIEQMGLALKTELEIGGIDSQAYANSMATALSMHLLRRYCTRQSQIKEYYGGLPSYKLKAVREYIHEHLERNLTLTKLAAIANLSPHYFASLFKQSTGFAPHQYLTRCRLEKAKQLLRQTNLPIIDISQEVGFQNQSHFTRVFRQYLKVTPKAYRDSF
ncbi:MAG: AraC family transcriptional regulator [Xenococcaceae cyanobacterium MO_188.B32]|nr:AraC family transcriptional regulator [Xenococcaceae cyanobacterium MO_188.B32]